MQRTACWLATSSGKERLTVVNVRHRAVAASALALPRLAGLEQGTVRRRTEALVQDGPPVRVGKDGALEISGSLQTEVYDVGTNSSLGADDVLGHHIVLFP